MATEAESAGQRPASAATPTSHGCAENEPTVLFRCNIKRFVLNNQIGASELRVLDDAGGNLGVMSRDKAIEIARNKGLDLVLVAPQANPPVARIVNFDKFRYEKDKALKKQRATNKAQEMKQIQISVREAMNDMKRKAKKIDEFIAEGHKIEIQLTLRGREKSMRDFTEAKLREFMKLIVTPYKVTQEIQKGGRGLLIQIDRA